jgi:hypothetical protein
MHGFLGCSMRVAGKVQACTSFGDDGHVDKAIQFARSSVKEFSVGHGKKKVSRALILLLAMNFDLCNEGGRN